MHYSLLRPLSIGVLEIWTDTLNDDVDKWYYFNAIEGNSYTITWTDIDENGNRNPANQWTDFRKVSAYQADKETPYFEEINLQPPLNTRTIIAARTERVYIKLGGIFLSNAPDSFEVKVTNP
jgi:hypothetical protein